LSVQRQKSHRFVVESGNWISKYTLLGCICYAKGEFYGKVELDRGAKRRVLS